MISSYHIGKEKAYFGAAIQLGMKVYVTQAKSKTLRLLNLPKEWYEIITD